jgi:protein SCO1/2
MGETPGWVLLLPAVNASLNGLATVLLLAGYAAIRNRRPVLHQRLMLTAFAVSIVFLGCYLAYHAGLHHYTGESGKKFQGVGVVRPIYFTILITHVILAATVPVLALITIYRAWKQQWDRHRRIAKITFPIWVYVSVTGVVIYAMLYHWPAAG